MVSFCLQVLGSVKKTAPIQNPAIEYNTYYYICGRPDREEKCSLVFSEGQTGVYVSECGDLIVFQFFYSSFCL